MIIPMKKLHVVLQDKDIEPALTRLAGAGVLHLEHFSIPRSDRLEDLVEIQERVDYVINFLKQSGRVPTQADCADVEEVFQAAEAAIDGVAGCEQRQRDLQAKIREWEPWGHFDPEAIRGLKAHGLDVELLAAPEAALAQLPQEVVVERVATTKDLVRAVVCSNSGALPGMDWTALPAHGLDTFRELRQKALKEQEALERKLRENACHIDALRSHSAHIGQRVAYQQALAGRRTEDGLSVIRGYCPVEAVQQLEEAAVRNQWACLVEEPAADDPVPTLLRNPKWVDLIQPVLNMLKILPGYREHDTSPVFLVFFSLFFGILIGDAGYGVAIVLAILAIQRKYGHRLRDPAPFRLMYILGGMTIVWGALTGTVLGQTLFPGIKPLVPWLSEEANVERLCFLIGAVHLSIAHVWRGVLKWPSIAVLAEVGWLSLLWGMFSMARLLVLGDPLPAGTGVLFITGPLLVVLCTRPERGLWQALGSGAGSLAMNLVNTFTDVVSYIRLFAVGLATVAVADAFNVMALDIGFNNLLAGILSASILLAGHLFNMVLGAMAILVHGVRLNVLEFASHMDLEWKGIEYQPLKDLNGND